MSRGPLRLVHSGRLASLYPDASFHAEAGAPRRHAATEVPGRGSTAPENDELAEIDRHASAKEGVDLWQQARQGALKKVRQETWDYARRLPKPSSSTSATGCPPLSSCLGLLHLKRCAQGCPQRCDELLPGRRLLGVEQPLHRQPVTDRKEE